MGRGYYVAIFDKVGAEETASKLKLEFGDSKVFGIECDVSNAISFRSAYDAALAIFEVTSFDVFVNNAGVFGCLFSDLEKQINVNLVGTIRGTEMAIKSATLALTQRAEKPLLVACTASSNGLIPADSDLASVYVSTKFGIVGLVRSLKPLAERFDVRVNAICPVTVDTPLLEGLLPTEVRAYLDAEGRGGVLPPSACAAALLRLIDDPSIAGSHCIDQINGVSHVLHSYGHIYISHLRR